ncbi:ricin-type beta-trefoil lectin protein [Streptomyces sp. BK208]|uniref:RICIN domain-containing protein n=1 Tax=Streptomyces sp. BK208 TaxID=2512150 RepID=UPI0010EA0C30|nr:RICIN domain-containing protein [Streptomyces sp. BK208]TDT41113.1 ricin-type beta-trefoil lectin protein [Streptomyces sp. BK208]
MSSRSWHRGSLALLATAGILAGGTAAASAQPTLGTRTVMAAQADAGPASGARIAADAVETYANMGTGSCLDDSQYGLRGYECNTGVYQRWSVHVWNDGTRQFRNVATGDCLYDDGVTLDTRSCNSSEQQSWWVYASGDRVTFENQATGECLDDSSFGLRTIGCNSSYNQKWR